MLASFCAKCGEAENLFCPVCETKRVDMQQQQSSAPPPPIALPVPPAPSSPNPTAPMSDHTTCNYCGKRTYGGRYCGESCKWNDNDI